MKVLIMPGTDPYLNLATEEYLLCNSCSRVAEDYLLLWRNDHTIVVGLHQNTIEEINGKFVEESGVRVVRRRTGGGAVYHDLGNLNFSFITSAHNASHLTMERFTLPVVAALSEMGLQAEASGRNDIMAEGLKVSGNAQTMHKQRFLHHGTLLFNSDLSILSQALKVKPEKFRSKSVKSVRSRVGNISELLPASLRDMSMEEFQSRIIESLCRESGAEYFELSAAEKMGIDNLAKEKYSSWEWIYGRSPQFSFRNMEKYDGGFIETCLDVKKGIIEDCVFFGDFMALRPAVEVAEKLKGCRYDPEDVSGILSSSNLQEYFGGIELSEILHCIFNANLKDSQSK